MAPRNRSTLERQMIENVYPHRSPRVPLPCDEESSRSRDEARPTALLPSAACLAVIFTVSCGDTNGPAAALPLTVLSVVDLGTYSGTEASSANAVNADGWIVGWSAPSTVLRPVIWSPDRAIALVDTISYLGCTATDVNASKWVVGQCFNSTAVLWRSTNERTRLDTVAAPSSYAAAINAFGQVVGSATRCSLCRVVSAVVWEADGALRYLDPLDGGIASRAADINASGDVVGTSFSAPASPSDPSLTRAVMWRSLSIVDLGTLPGFPASEAIALNDRGAVVGNSCTPTCYSPGSVATRGFLWDNGSLADLGARKPSAINNHGVVVGTGESGPFVWASGRVAELEPLPGTTSCNAYAISDAGHVVGSCFTQSGFQHATLWVISIDL
jgi:uncharacterized membrane protein